MTQVVLNISNKKDLSFIRSLSKRMGWTISHPEATDEPNEETAAVLRDVREGVNIEPFDYEAFHAYAQSL